ncbi:MAG: PspC domain-containing protein [Acidimicrobiia bacterium]
MTQLDTGPPKVAADKNPVRLRRSTEDRVVAGICGGLGQYFNTDPIWFRLGFVVLTLGGGAGVLIYLIAWLAIPEAGPGETAEGHHGGLDNRGPLVAGVILIAIGLVLLFNNLVPWFDRVAWPLAVIATGAGLLFLGGRHDHN